MRYLAYLTLILAALGADAHEEEDEPIESASGLREWCKAESEAYFVAEGVTPYNWSASWHEEGNTLIVDGEWRVGSDQVAVTCRVMKGARKKNAVYEIRR